jgi:hypothetical protein
MGHDFDWEGWLKARVPGLTEEREGGKAFLKSGRDFPPVPPGICFHVADRRTLVLDTEQGMRMRLATKDRPPPPTWLADWERVGRAPLALALNPEHEEWRERLKAGDLSSSAMALFDHTTALAASVDCAEGKLVVRALANSATEADRARARTAWQGLLAEGARAAADFQAEDEDSARTKQLRRLVEAVLRQNAVEEDGNRIRWRAEVRADAADLWDVLSFDNLPPVSD